MSTPTVSSDCSPPKPIRTTLYSLGRLALIAAMALVIAGCAACEDDTGSDDPDVCTVDNECDSDEVCRNDICTEVCELDEDCGDEMICSAGRFCVPDAEAIDCDTDHECPSRSCVDGQCEPTDRCDVDGDCFDEQFCSPDGYCVPHCENDMECADGEICHDGRCVIGGSCDSDDECGDGGVCTDGSCQVACDNDDDCGQDGLCFDGHCSAMCESDDECDDDGLCWRGLCVPVHPEDPTLPAPGGDPSTPDNDDDPDAGFDDAGDPVDPAVDRDDATSCADAADCADGERCEDGLCVTDGICHADSDCSPGSTCQRGRCRLACDSDEHCRSDETCGDDGICESADTDPPSCSSSQDCGPAERCESGECATVTLICVTGDQCGIDGDANPKSCVNGLCHFGCDDDGDCPYGHACDDGVCQVDTDNATCSVSADCDGDESCINGFCYDACDETADCVDEVGGHPEMICDYGVCQPNYTPGAECQDPAVCGEGNNCFDGYCTVPCDDGSECLSGTCEDGFCIK